MRKRRALLAELYEIVDELGASDADAHLEACEAQLNFAKRGDAKRGELAATVVAWESNVREVDASVASSAASLLDATVLHRRTHHDIVLPLEHGSIIAALLPDVSQTAVRSRSLLAQNR